MAVPGTPLFLFSLNYGFWGLMGLSRFILGRDKPKKANLKINSAQVAAIVPAKNEAPVIKKTIASLKKFLPPKNIHVVSDGSSDDTEKIARKEKVNVLAFKKSKGKAGALTAGINFFKLTKKFKAVLFVDADTIIGKNYLKNALPFFNDSRVAAIAGSAKTLWQPEKQSFWNSVIIAHRERMYFLTQILIRYGQTWGPFNVCPIIPGFASLYRSQALEKIKIKKPGIIIEDFNMTFEVHKKKLGKIVYHPGVYGNTQDPSRLRDYFKQMNRWSLGFWQTIRHHGVWPSFFWVVLLIYLTEVVLSSLILLCLPILAIILLLPGLSNGLILELPYFKTTYNLLFSLTDLPLLFYSFYLPDYLLTCLTVIAKGRAGYLIYGLFFPFLKMIDAYTLVFNLPKAWLTSSSGSWISPQRYQVSFAKSPARNPKPNQEEYESRKS
ncbi:MAG: glycosyltransferase [Candidatus Pacebacteria bacterium]|nr:glycosyltransferase [Candidatus Paceibacterota bacterium]